MIIYGKRVIEWVALEYPSKLQCIYLAKEIKKEFFAFLKTLQKPIIKLDNKKAQSLAKGANHQGFLAEASEISMMDFALFKQMDLVLVLSGITDVGNLGSLIRSAYALGVDGVIFCEMTRLRQEGVVHASVGALFGMPFCVVKNTHDVIHQLHYAGFSLYGTSAKPCPSAPLTKAKRALFLGNEAEGLSARILSKMDYYLHIPMAHAFHSLNVSAAGAILIDRMVNGRVR